MTAKGECHICVAEGRHEIRTIDYCPICRHWFCAECRSKWFSRTWEFLKERFGGKHPGCCGIMVP